MSLLIAENTKKAYSRFILEYCHHTNDGDGSLFGKLLVFFPLITTTNILQLLFNTVDMVVIGRFSGDDALATAGATGVLINLIITLFMGLSVGTNVVVA